MSEEILVTEFLVHEIMDIMTVNRIVIQGYEKTGNKFSVNFNGSKGYLSNVEIIAEGTQKERNNFILIEQIDFRNAKRKKLKASIYHSDQNGVRINLDWIKKAPTKEIPLNKFLAQKGYPPDKLPKFKGFRPQFQFLNTPFFTLGKHHQLRWMLKIMDKNVFEGEKPIAIVPNREFLKHGNGHNVVFDWVYCAEQKAVLLENEKVFIIGYEHNKKQDRFNLTTTELYTAELDSQLFNLPF